MSSIIKIALMLVLCAGLCSQCRACDDHGEDDGKPYHYIGCYRDTAVRDLQRHAATSYMSPGRCHRECGRWGFKYFGLQYTYYCFCGNVYGMYGKVDDRECNMHCDGNKDKWCGGLWRNSVYRVTKS